MSKAQRKHIMEMREMTAFGPTSDDAWLDQESAASSNAPLLDSRDRDVEDDDDGIDGHRFVTRAPSSSTTSDQSQSRDDASTKAASRCSGACGTLWKILTYSRLNALLVFVPLGMTAHVLRWYSSIVLSLNALAIVPLSALLAVGTENVSWDLGDAVGALMNISLGNVSEVIIFM